MEMFLNILIIIFQSTSNAVAWVVSLFAAFGLNWAYVIAGGMALSIVLRLFVRAFIGDRIGGEISDVVNRDRIESKQQAAAAEKAHKQSYEYYKENRSRNEAYDKRYRAETG